MALIPWRAKRQPMEPSSAMERSGRLFRSDLDQLFDRFFRDPWAMSALERWAPGFGEALRADLSETDDEVCVTVDVPGVEAEDLDISVSGNILTIHGEKRQDREEKKRSYHMVERQYGSFRRSVQLPAYVDAANVDASFHNGVLTLRMPKRAEAKPRKITVQKG